jgi:two-component system chemotaxis response regulator CheB
MSQSIRVMLCDESAIMRRLISTALRLEPSMAVVCEAHNGRDAIEKLDDARPDILVMDIGMPVMNGVEAVREIRRRHPDLPIIMLSSLTSRGAKGSLDAITAGATDVSTKPVGSTHIQQSLDALRRDLIPKLLHWTAGQPTRSRPQTTDCSSVPRASRTSASSSESSSQISAIAIGVSTGGPQALATLIQELPMGFPIPILIAQHMPPVFTRLLAERLSAQTGHSVREAVDGDELDAGTILVAPGDHHLTVSREGDSVRARLNQEPPENACRPSVNPLFCSMAECYGQGTLGIVLTGTGQDGVRGVKRLKTCGATVFAQDQESSVIWGMPGQVVKMGLADQVLPIDQMAAAVLRAVNPNRVQAVAAVSERSTIESPACPLPA